MIRPYLGFISITLMPAILACLTISAVPRPPGKAITKSGPHWRR